MNRPLHNGLVAIIATFFCSLSLFAQNSSPYWSIAGNNNATGTSKLGTTNNVSVHIYTNNIQRMYIDSSNGRVGIGVSVPADRLHVNSASGENAFRAQVNGVTRLLVHSNGGVAIGANTTPPSNGGLYVSGSVGIGTNTPQALLDVNGGAHINSDALINGLTVGKGGGNVSTNSAFGFQALYSATAGGDGNTAIGYQALYRNEGGRNNTATGIFALVFNYGESNTANGGYALETNAFGSFNTASGVEALSSNYNGDANTATGINAMRLNTDGSSNVAIGADAMESSQSNSNNVAVGDSALLNYSDGALVDYMVAIGTKALLSNTTGFWNTSVGGHSLLNNTTGYGNTALGASALNTVTTGYGNTALGYNANVNSATRFNATAIGYGATATADNQVMLGNTSVTSVKAGGTITIVSDGRFKKNIKENVPGLDFINLLKPVTYNYDIHGLNKFIGVPEDQKRNGTQDVEKAMANKEKIQYTGFVAQDVEKAANKINYDFSGIYKPQNDKDPYGLGYSDFIPSLVKAVQELSKQNDSLRSANNNQQKQMDALTERMNKLETTLAASGKGASATSLPSSSLQTVQLGSAATLEQNVPNPFSGSTTINYYLPQNNGNAYINFISSNGTLLKSVKLSGNGKGTLTLKTSDLPSGVYRYNLLVDGIYLGSKQMVLSK